MNVVDLVDVTKTYDSEPPVHALRHVDLTVTAGEFVAVVGPSGSGKSTLLNLVGALDRPTSGTVRIAGQDIGGLDDAELSGLRGHHIGFVFQSFNLIDGLNAAENVGLGLIYSGVPAARRDTLAREALDRVGLASRAEHAPGRLSGGERQRVAIARALVGAPALLLADEPTGNLDSVTGASIIETFQRLHQDGSTILMITHDQTLAAATPRQVSMHDGAIVPSAPVPA